MLNLIIILYLLDPQISHINILAEFRHIYEKNDVTLLHMY